MRIRKMIMIDARSLHVKLFFGHAPRMKIIRITILSAHMGGELNLMCFLEKLCGKKSCFLKKKISTGTNYPKSQFSFESFDHAKMKAMGTLTFKRNVEVEPALVANTVTKH